MINRKTLFEITEKLQAFAAVGIIGPRQVGKTTLALEVGTQQPSVYLDLENPLDLAKLDDPLGYFSDHADKLIILDEIQRKPEIFGVLRSVIDQNRRRGKRYGQFLILGSASVDLLRQSSESLAGRITYVEMTAICISEYTDDRTTLWIRGGFPDSLLAASDKNSVAWRQSFIHTYVEREIPFFNPRIPTTTMRRLWTMVAHSQGDLFNASKLASSLGVSNNSVARYLDLLADLFLIRYIQPWYGNVKKRIIKSPKFYVRDSGILHALLNLGNLESVLSHPVVGTSWEGFVIENIIAVLPESSEVFFYRTSGGAEIDLVVQHANGKKIAVEIKKNAVPKLERGFYEACKDIEPDEKYVVYAGTDTFFMRNEVMAVSVEELVSRHILK